MWGRKRKEAQRREEAAPSGTQPGLDLEPLTAAWEQALRDRRDWVAASVAGNEPPLDLGEPMTAISVVSAILADGVGPDEGFKLEALGVVLGDALSVMLAIDGVPCPWLLVTDEWGTTPALHLGAQAVMYPMSMIAKRVEAGETVDVRELVIAALQHAEQVRAEADL